MQEIAADGHCAAPWDTLVDAAVKLLEIAAPIIEEAVHAEVAEENLVQEDIGGKLCLFLTPLHRAETGAATGMLRLLRGQPSWGTIVAEKAIPWVEGKTGLTFSDSQRDALTLSLSSKVVVITGGPGVGKTTLVNSILHVIHHTEANIAYNSHVLINRIPESIVIFSEGRERQGLMPGSFPVIPYAGSILAEVILLILFSDLNPQLSTHVNGTNLEIRRHA